MHSRGFDAAGQGKKTPNSGYYEGVKLDQSYRLDLLVQQKIIVEIKAVESITTVHRAQLLSYLKLTGCPIGLLINFNVELLKEGICRMVNNFSETPEFIASLLSD